MRNFKLNHNITKENIKNISLQAKIRAEDSFNRNFDDFLNRILKDEYQLWIKSSYSKRLDLLIIRDRLISNYVYRQYGKFYNQLNKKQKKIIDATQVKINAYYLKIYKTTGEYGYELEKYIRGVKL